MPRHEYAPPSGIPRWDRVDRSRFDEQILAELPGPDDAAGVSTSDLRRRLDLVAYEQDTRLRPRLRALQDDGWVERIGAANSIPHRWRRTRKRTPPAR
jgi:hypothetical protein